ncbi:hypothetical protein XNC1_2507 [Xenorhabdus nematophila ATCC 19061]|uniref:Uncharacterized protein n=1 Tax=Xenorhabdus nematophila (strain ATCC 19061 / DSM 3370 / CCUG 14189 / LMG 1036 / NCIMB 9965 / AN6) TaxID=406817 RepID=D3VHC0_XENNA|nr:hypothetical protein XNC1_2507 [Xenorhabdus nematophila ATCC 19061]
MFFPMVPNRQENVFVLIQRRCALLIKKRVKKQQVSMIAEKETIQLGVDL